MKVRITDAVQSVGLAAFLAVAFASVPLIAVAGSDSEGVTEMSSGAAQAFMRDFDLDERAMHERLAAEQAATDAYRQLLQEVDHRFYAGSWFDEEEGALVVAVTDESALTTVRGQDARPVVVDYSLAELDAAVEKLNQAATRSGEGALVRWYVDVRGNEVVVEVLQSARSQAVDVLAASGISLDLVRIEETRERPALFNDIRGGDPYFDAFGNHLCSIGFSVTGGFLTAGHCHVVSQVYGAGGNLMGSFAGSTYPGDDMAYVSTVSGWNLTPWVNDYSGGVVVVQGSQAAPVGATVCRSGYTTGYHCGTIQSWNVSVNYGDGPVSGLLQTTACAWYGDSGGSLITPAGQAQGVVSGGSTSPQGCGSPTYYQPVNPMLQEYSVSLVTAGGQPPGITLFTCPDLGSSGNGTYTCNLNFSGSGSTQWFINGVHFPSFDGQTWLFDSCASHSTVSVQVVVSNNYGSDSRHSSFQCPTGPIP